MRKEKKATALLKILCYSKGYEGKTMNYKNTIRGIFKDRPNRFIAHVQIGDQLETVHVKNTGRCVNLPEISGLEKAKLLRWIISDVI